MWNLKGTPKTFRVTTKLATEFAEMDAVNIDRPLSERRLQVYERMVRAGGFRPVTWAKAYCLETDQHYRVNGKHTSTLLSRLDLKAVPDQHVIIEEYDCETLADVAQLYATYDSKTMTRTAGDINHSFAVTIPEMKDMERGVVNLLVAALDYEQNPSTNYGGGTAAGKTAAEKAEALFDNVEVCQWVTQIVPSRGGGSKHSHLCRTPVVAAMMGTWRKSRADATKFWLAVTNETGPSPTLPDRKLARWLLQMKVGGGGRGGSDTPKRFKALPKEFYVKCVHAWNAWRKDETTNLQYYADKPIPAIR